MWWCSTTTGCERPTATFSRISLSSGQAVVAGQPVGLASTWLYFGLRDGDTYRGPHPLSRALAGQAAAGAHRRGERHGRARHRA